MASTVWEEIIDDQANDREEEDEKAPEEFIDRWAGRFDNLNEDDDIENQNNKADNTTTGAVAPGIRLNRDIPANGGCKSNGGEQSRKYQE